MRNQYIGNQAKSNSVPHTGLDYDVTNVRSDGNANVNNMRNNAYK